MSPKDSFLNRLARCQTQPRFIPEFYRRFMASSKEVAAKFRFTDSHATAPHAAAIPRTVRRGTTAGDPDGLAELIGAGRKRTAARASEH